MMVANKQQVCKAVDFSSKQRSPRRKAVDFSTKQRSPRRKAVDTNNLDSNLDKASMTDSKTPQLT